MRVTTKGKYGLMVMVEIASNDTGRAIPLKQIAHQKKVSEKYLEQIIISLSKAGYVRSIRGSRGGYVMGVDPAELTVGQIILVLEGEQSMRACIGEVGECPRKETCAMIDVFRAVNEAVSQVVDHITLADLVQRRREKCEALGMQNLDTVFPEDKPACSE